MLGLMVNEPNIKPCDLSQVTVPVLVICGTRDMIKESHTRMTAKNLPNGKLAIIKGNHFIADKCPTEFNRAVEHFLDRL